MNDVTTIQFIPTQYILTDINAVYHGFNREGRILYNLLTIVLVVMQYFQSTLAHMFKHTFIIIT